MACTIHNSGRYRHGEDRSGMGVDIIEGAIQGWFYQCVFSITGAGLELNMPCEADNNDDAQLNVPVAYID